MEIVHPHVQNNIQKATKAVQCHDVQNVSRDDFEDEQGEAVWECRGRWVVMCHHTWFNRDDGLKGMKIEGIFEASRLLNTMKSNSAEFVMSNEKTSASSRITSFKTRTMSTAFSLSMVSTVKY